MNLNLRGAFTARLLQNAQSGVTLVQHGEKGECMEKAEHTECATLTPEAQGLMFYVILQFSTGFF